MTPIEAGLNHAISEQKLPEIAYPDFDNLVKVNEQITLFLISGNVASSRELNAKLIESGTVNFVLDNPLHLDPSDRNDPMSQELAISTWIYELSEAINYQISRHCQSEFLTTQEQSELQIIHDNITKLDIIQNPQAISHLIQLTTLMAPFLYIDKESVLNTKQSSRLNSLWGLDLQFFKSDHFQEFIKLGLTKPEQTELPLDLLITKFRDWVLSISSNPTGLTRLKSALSCQNELIFSNLHADMWQGLYRVATKSDTFSERMSGVNRPEMTIALLKLIFKTLSYNEYRAIRMTDLIFDVGYMGFNPTRINQLFDWPDSPDIRTEDYQGSFTEEDWGIFIKELCRPDSLFLSDEEMGLLDTNPKTANRYRVAALWTGRAHDKNQEKFTGNMQACIEKLRSK